MDECYFPLYLAKFLVSELEEKGTNLNNNLYNACREIVRLNAEVDRLNKLYQRSIEVIKGLDEEIKGLNEMIDDICDYADLQREFFMKSEDTPDAP